MKRILVVEDDLALSAGLCFELDSGGYISVSAYTYQKAFQLVKEDRFDLVLLDVNLPDGNGFDLCKAIKALRPEIPVIFLRPMIWSRMYWMVLIWAPRIM